MRFVTTITPAADLRIAALPRDLCLLDGRFEPSAAEGRLFTCQTGNTAGQAFFQVPGNDGGSVLYFQNLSSLTDYCRQTGAKIADTVAVEWPDAGFALPGGDGFLPAQKPMVIRDTFVEVHQG